MLGGGWGGLCIWSLSLCPGPMLPSQSHLPNSGASQATVRFPYPRLLQGCGCRKSAPGHTAWLAEFSGQAGRDGASTVGEARLENQGTVNWDGPDTVGSSFSSPGPRPPIICQHPGLPCLVSSEVGAPLLPVRFSIYPGRVCCLSEDGGDSGKSPNPQQTATSRCPDAHPRDP